MKQNLKKDAQLKQFQKTNKYTCIWKTLNNNCIVHILLGANKRVHSIGIFIFFPHPTRTFSPLFHPTRLLNFTKFLYILTRLENFQKIFQFPV